APERFAKTLRTERAHGPLPQLVTVADDSEQARFVATRVLANREAGASLKAQAALFRASHHSAALELELTRRNVPFVKYGGLKFLDAAHVKDAVALLRFAENPRDRIAGFRVARLLPGIGPKIAETIVAAAGAGDGFAAMAALAPPARARAGFPAFAGLMRRLAARAAPWPAEIADAVGWLSPLIEARYDDARVRLNDLEALERIAASYPSRERFLSELALDPPETTSDESGPPHRDEDYFILSTIHSAKGQEWRSVFVLNCVDGCIPSDLATGSSEEIEEERRLLYVAMTRAKDELALIVPQRFYVHGQPRAGDRSVYASRTRFIPPSLLRHFDRSTWPEAEPAPLSAAPDGPRVDLQARMRAMWR
ncbi:MAG TPA: ATP-dependent helicase, partial [Roseiarcus sp.]|nr:ATP-dependent helicase [Roseiarcus sp.]